MYFILNDHSKYVRISQKISRQICKERVVLATMPKTKQFDREEVLTKAMEVFWRQGYEATSVHDLMGATGLKPGSIYDTFGDKHGLFMAAIQHYRQTVISRSLTILQAPGSVRKALENYFNLILERFARADHKFGCLMSNTTTELIVRDQKIAEVVSDHLQTIEQTFREALERGVRQGEFSPNRDLTALARFLTTCVVGLSVVSKTPQAASYFPASIEVILSTLN
jgi:TetR/AcrR family transcriptional repressor of nem operon